MGTLGCAACGPGSLLGPRHPQSECVLSRDRCAQWDIDKYIACRNCKNKYSPDCLRKLSEKVHEHESSLSKDLSVHDPQGVWQILKDQPWLQGTAANVLSNACAFGFLPKTSSVSASIPQCFSCEEGQIPEPVRPEAANWYRQLGADLNVRVVLLLPIEELLVTGEMEATVRILDLIEAYPVLPGEFGRELFQNGEGTVAEMGSSACSDV
jgi:hypothetical protein